MRANWGGEFGYPTGVKRLLAIDSRPYAKLDAAGPLAHNHPHEARAVHTRRQQPLRHYYYFELATTLARGPLLCPKPETEKRPPPAAQVRPGTDEGRQELSWPKRIS